MIVMMVLIGVVNIFIPLVCLPKFEQIFQDAFGIRPIPTLTLWIIAERVPLIIAAIVWPIAGLLIVRRLKLASVLWLYFPFALSIGQCLLTLWSLFLPMLNLLIAGTSDSM